MGDYDRGFGLGRNLGIDVDVEAIMRHASGWYLGPRGKFHYFDNDETESVCGSMKWKRTLRRAEEVKEARDYRMCYTCDYMLERNKPKEGLSNEREVAG